MTQRVLVAMSGGVDSSVAAARLVRQGYEVIGVTLHLWDYPDDGSVRGRCCAPEDIHDASRVADRLGIDHFTFDRRDQFQRDVVNPFVDAYLGGRTPSPCVQCNRSVKIAELLELATDLAADRVATGHYARIDYEHQPSALLRAVDANKDQSYFLHMLPPSTLERLLFPLGESTKAEVRAEAHSLGLSGAEKSESQELCFVPQGRYDEFVANRARERLRPGAIVDERGNVLGSHEGIHRFTVGQRRHLGVALGKRSYVVSVDALRQRVTVGSSKSLDCISAAVDEASLAPDVALPITCGVAIRYRAQPMAARVERRGERGLNITFEQPVKAVVPGQVAVLYAGQRVLGGGTIVAAAQPQPSEPPSGGDSIPREEMR